MAVPIACAIICGCGAANSESNISKYSYVSLDTLYIVDTLQTFCEDPILDVSSVCFDGEGSIYYLDRFYCRIEKFNPEGNHVRSISRRGHGPGEISVPTGFTILNDDRLMVVDNASMRCLFFSPQGDFLGSSISWGSSVPNDIHAIGDSSFVGTVFSIEQVEQGVLIACNVSLFTASSEPDVTYYRREWCWSPESSHIMYEEYERIIYTADSNYNFYLVPDAGNYVIQMYDVYGNIKGTIERSDLTRVEKPEDVIDLEKEAFERRASQDQAYAGGYEPDPHYALIRGLGVADDGLLWVCRGDMYPTVVFDIWDHTGEIVKTVYIDPSLPVVFESCTVGTGGIVGYIQNSNGTLTLYLLGAATEE
jgi:hypothetical protein